MNSNQKKFNDIYKKLGLPKNCPGLNWRNLGKEIEPDQNFDEELLPLLKEMNKLPFCHTTGSCAGHSIKELKENWGLGWGIEIPYRITIILHLKNDDRSIKKFIAIAQAFAKVSSERFLCELGYSQLDDYQDLNKITEKGYMPFEIQVFADTKRRRDNLIEKYTKILEDKRY